MDELKYLHMNYFLGEDVKCFLGKDKGFDLEIHFEYYSGSNYVSDWQNFEPDELIDLIDHKTDIREYQIKYILENPIKSFLIDFLIEDLNGKIHKIITIDFEDVIIKRKEEQDIEAGLSYYDQEIFSSPDIE